ncbi:MAG: UbiA-like polyprenyltransferase [Desulfococcaceae bacterium]
MKKKHPIFERIVTYGRMVKFSHTVFALPFALSAVVLAQREHPLTLWNIFWVLTAMFGARSAAMGFNRIMDAQLDAHNPRTQNREIPKGKLSVTAAKIFVVIFSLLFILSAAMLGTICFWLSFPVLAVLFFYSYTKHFTWTAHLWLGFAISLAPLGAWLAIAKSFDPEILWLSLALLTYISGFDVLYACQDEEFDRKMGLYSIPAVFGAASALTIAKLIHFVSYLSFMALYFVFDMGQIYLMTTGIIGLLLIFEHWLVKPDDLSHVNIAFFHVNSVISVTLFIGVLADEIARGHL